MNEFLKIMGIIFSVLIANLLLLQFFGGLYIGLLAYAIIAAPFVGIGLIIYLIIKHLN